MEMEATGTKSGIKPKDRAVTINTAIQLKNYQGQIHDEYRVMGRVTLAGVTMATMAVMP